MTKIEQRQREWAGRIADYKASGLTMATWCSAHGVTLEQLKYWMQKLKKITSVDAVSSSARFIPITVAEPAVSPAPSSLVVRVGSASISLQKGFDPQLLREAVEALSTPC